MQNPQAALDHKERTEREDMPIPAGLYKSAETADPAEFELALRPWELLCQPRDSGLFSHTVQFFAAPRFLLYQEIYGLGVNIRGLSPPEMLVISLPFKRGNSSSFWGKALDDGLVPCALPGPASAHLVTRYGQRVAGVRIDTLREVASPAVFDRLVKQAREHLMPCSAALRTRFSNWIESRLHRLSARPDLADSPAHTQALFDEIVALFVELGEEIGDERRLPQTTAMKRGLHRALEYIREAPPRNLSLTSLCAVSGISERSLQYAFRDAMGMTPKEFILQRRLHATRRALLNADVSLTRVSDVATDHGFYELGRFAGRYRSLFGERPSETLRRNA